MRLPRQSICFIFLATVAIGCHTNVPLPSGRWFEKTPPPMSLNGTRAEMRAELLSHVPVGASLEEARAVMKRNGFVCRSADEESRQVLVCTKRQQAGSELAYEWRVELFHDGDNVTGADVAMLGFGPGAAQPAAEPEN